jgi:hypothetical protein
MMMDTVGTNPDNSYHALSGWGMDILKCGNSLGAGALALSVPRKGAGDTLVRLGGQHIKKETFESVADGPIRAIFRMSYDWEINGKPVHITELTTIWAGQYFYESKISVQGAPAGTRLVTGIANFYSNESGHFEEGNAELLFSHGQQSENKDFLGMGILVGKPDFAAFGSTPVTGTDITSTYTVAQHIKKDGMLAFRFYAGWERTEPGFSSREYFKSFLGKEAEKFSHPVELKFLNNN